MILEKVAQLGPLIVVSGTILSVFIGYTLRQRGQRKKLRESLKAEIESIETIDDFEGGSLQILLYGGSPSSSVYQSNTDKLGLLTTEEARKIINFYNSVDMIKSLVQASYRAVGEDKLFEKGQVSAKQKKLARNMWDKVMELRNETLEEIEKNL